MNIYRCPLLDFACHYNQIFLKTKTEFSLFCPFLHHSIYIQKIFNNLSPLLHQLYH